MSLRPPGQTRPSRFRLLAFDLDGTFLDRDGTLADATTRFLDRTQADGIELVAATGRRLWSALPVLERAQLRGRCVVHNGAMVARVPEGVVEHSVRLPVATSRVLLELLKARDFAALAFTDAPRGPGEVLVEEGAADPTGYLAWYFHYAFGHVSFFPELTRAPLDGVLRLVTHGERGRLEELVREVETRFGGEVRAFVQQEMVLPAHRVEILARAASKWAGVAWIADRLGIAPAEILAVGDEANDVEMLTHAGWSLAAPGASAEARRAAREVVAGAGPADLLRAIERVLRR